MDSEGNVYQSIEEMWDAELNENSQKNISKKAGSKDQWYSKALDYWKVIFLALML